MLGRLPVLAALPVPVPQQWPGASLASIWFLVVTKRLTQCLVFVDPNDIPEKRIVWLLPGDIIVVRSGAYTGDSAIIPDRYGRCIAGFDMVLSCHEAADPMFVQYTLLSKYLKEGQIDLEKMRAAQPHLNAEELGACLVVFPTVKEQRAIAAFLNRETAKIDALIAEQQRLIALLAEKRQATISHAVTKGLNPDAPLKDSGIEWLGAVPEGWEVKPLKSLTSDIKAGPFGSALTKDMHVSEGYRVYGQEQVIPGDFSIGDYYISPEKYAELQPYAIAEGDILVSCVGTFGKIAIVPKGIEPGIINPRLIRLHCVASVLPEYLTAVLRSNVVFEQFSFLSRGGTMDVINIGTLCGIVLALPPPSEQEQILTFLDRETAKFDTLTTEAQRAITLLQERRTALISAAVTGKIDVRGLVDQEPT